MQVESRMPDADSETESRQEKEERFLKLFTELLCFKTLEYNLDMVKARITAVDCEAEKNAMTQKEAEKLRTMNATFASDQMRKNREYQSARAVSLLSSMNIPVDAVIASCSEDQSRYIQRKALTRARQREAALESENMEKGLAVREELKAILEDESTSTSALMDEHDKKSEAKLKSLRARLGVLSNIMKVLLLNTEKLGTDDRLDEILLDLVNEE